ncbi:hypothetical protein KIW84_061037 [Lathyrus oleraceus]|uniref:Uncharacterized protein n=1 Tax=Pisum sativum TaxID=3888 RepID=A0A9D4W4J7_PEA|nr:hypothetical protein KIW84_061037 [Pisum sativum]
MYVFYAQSVQVAKKYVPLATQLHKGRKICLNRLILFGLYESIGLSCEDLKSMGNPYSLQIGGPIWLIELWLNVTFEPSLKTKVPPSLEAYRIGTFFKTIKDDPIALSEIQGIVIKLRKPEVPSPIVDFVLEFEPLLEKVIQVVMKKQEFVNQFEMRAEILREHQIFVSEYQLQVVKLEAKAKAKSKMATFEVDILSWT